MAASNWDTFALDISGRPVGGYLTNAEGVGVEIYKNWIYVHDQRVTNALNRHPGDNEPASQQHLGFADDTIMEITEGVVRYGHWTIIARRGPREGVYVVAYHQRGSKSEGHSDQVLLVGCGVYGWQTFEELHGDFIAKMGIDSEAVVMGGHIEDGRWVSTVSILQDDEYVINPETGDMNFVLPNQADPRFIGVGEPELQFLRDMVVDVAGPAYTYSANHDKAGEEILEFPGTALRALDFSAGLRINQGDLRYFGATQATPVGQADEPELTKFVKLIGSAQPDDVDESSP